MTNEKILKKIFRKDEISGIENFYCYTERKKIIVFVPLKFTDRLTTELSKAGAGRIGNYEMCSFRVEGTGTFIPNKNAKPFLGKKEQMSSVREIKLEMECSAENINTAVGVLLKYHPYDEAAYEIHSFMKRDKVIMGTLVCIGKNFSCSELIKRSNSKLEDEMIFEKKNIGRIVVTEKNITEKMMLSAKFINADCIISNINKKFNLTIL